MSQRHVIHAGRIVNLGLERARLPNGTEVELEVIRHPGASAVVPLHPDGTVTLVHQYRHSAGHMLYEVPAGVIDDGEAPELCAARELAEEAQLEGTLEYLTTIHTTPGFTDERIHLFLVTDPRPAPGRPEADEYIQVVRLPFAEALEMCGDGRITDGKTICALHLASARIQRP